MRDILAVLTGSLVMVIMLIIIRPVAKIKVRCWDHNTRQVFYQKVVPFFDYNVEGVPIVPTTCAFDIIGVYEAWRLKEINMVNEMGDREAGK